MNRRSFIIQGGLASASMAVGSKGWALPSEEVRLTILHTNDVHSRLDPFPMDGSMNAGNLFYWVFPL